MVLASDPTHNAGRSCPVPRSASLQGPAERHFSESERTGEGMTQDQEAVNSEVKMKASGL